MAYTAEWVNRRVLENGSVDYDLMLNTETAENVHRQSYNFHVEDPEDVDAAFLETYANNFIAAIEALEG